ncbi:hypothetical protein CEXT_399611 [Caerostris extrusa]|uniref:Uncharacterized protein n=1 Tax=Caerostris extrusa TaxID=172846 RepID=A0AAV4QKM7_CAEEX|nr:hypothetical protein CEXT_399611 [Caerostris extrusa]
MVEAKKKIRVNGMLQTSSLIQMKIYDDSEEADKHFLQRAPKQGWLGNFFAGLITAKNNLRGLPRSEYLPGEGDPPTHKPEKTPDARVRSNQPITPGKNRTEQYGGKWSRRIFSNNLKVCPSSHKRRQH